MRKHLCILLLMAICPLLEALAGSTPLDIRLEYMLKQVDNGKLEHSLRCVWADSVLSHADDIEDKSILERTLMRRAEIYADGSYYRRSLNSYLEWIEAYRDTADESRLLMVYDKVAELYYFMGWYNLAVELSYGLSIRDKPDSLRYLDVRALQRLAHCYIRLRNVEMAERYTAMADSTLAAVGIPDDGHRLRAMFEMNILKAGMSIINMDYDATHRYLSGARRYASGIRDSISIWGDEAILYELVDDGEIAGKFYKEILNTGDVSYQSVVCINNYVYYLANRGRFKAAHEVCDSSYRMLDLMELDHARSNLMMLESDIYFREGDYRNAYLSLSRSKVISDSLFSPENMNHLYRISDLTDKSDSLRRISERDDRISRLKAYIWIGIGFIMAVLAVISVLLVVMSRKKHAQKENLESMEAAIDAREKELETARLEIDSKTRQLESYMQTIGETSDLLRRIRNVVDDKADPADRLATVDRMLAAEKFRYGDWDSTRGAFEKIHSKLVSGLTANHPDLTKAEISIAVFILMDIPTKEIADLRNLSVRTVENTKYRLYKKLGVPAAEVASYLKKFL